MVDDVGTNGVPDEVREPEQCVTASGKPYMKNWELAVISADLPPPIPSELWAALSGLVDGSANLIAELAGDNCEVHLSLVIKPTPTHIKPDYLVG